MPRRNRNKYKKKSGGIEPQKSTENSIPDFATISEEAKAEYEREKFDPEASESTARAIVELSAKNRAADPETNPETQTEKNTHTEESKGVTFKFSQREYVMSEEEKIMEAFRNGTVCDSQENETLSRVAEQMQKLDEEIGKTPDTADTSVVIPDIGTSELESDGESDVDSDTEPMPCTTSIPTDTEVTTGDTVDFVADSREYRRELDRHNDETLPVEERIQALEELKASELQESGETPLFTEWLANFYRDSDLAANRELALSLLKLQPDWLSLNELMVIASFLFSGTRVRYKNMVEWKALVGFYNSRRAGLPKSIPGIHHITITRWLLEHPKLFQQGRLCFRDLLARSDVPSETVYRLVLYCKVTDSRREELHKTHFTHPDVSVRYKILSAQNLPAEITGKLLGNIMRDNMVEVRIRADIVDLFINHGTEFQRIAAMEVLEELGADAYNVYNNRENVHNHRVTESAVAIVDSLYDILLDTADSVSFKKSLESLDVISSLKTRWETRKDYSTFKLALLRIELDRQLYGSHRLSLVQILNLVIKYINAEFSADHELHERVYQELVDSALEGETCSSGHAFRLVNALSGYTEFSVQVSFDDQMSAYFQREFQRLLENSEHADILLELGDSTESFLSKPETLAFVNENLHTIREKLYEDFRENLTDLEFDETFQRVAVKYGVVV